MRSGGEIIDRCTQETALPAVGRLDAEFTRMVTTIEDFAERIDSGYVGDIHIIEALPERQPRPRPDIRSRRLGIGPVVVLESSNFPLAFGALGGDTVSAWAAGCPVIVKTQPWHAGTSTLIAECVSRAIEKCGMPAGMFSLLHGGVETAQALILNESVRGVGFTGSRRGGMAIRSIASQRQRPLDALSLEMGSVNPMFLFSGALQQRAMAIADGLAAAVFIGCGQFCTKPGIVFIDVSDSAAAAPCITRLSQLFEQSNSFQMLGGKFVDDYNRLLGEMLAIEGVNLLAQGKSEPGRTQAHLLEMRYETFAQADLRVREEIFGPVTMLVLCSSVEEFSSAVSLFEGELTGTLHYETTDLPDVQQLIPDLEIRVGRIIANGFPPGVEVCDAMNHSGPWPAAYGNTTVVGPSSVARWLRPVCYQQLPTELLPSELSDPVSQGMQRTRNGKRGSH